MITLLFVTTLLLGCSKDDSDTPNKSNTLNPPSWIQGTWENEVGLAMTFTSNDMFNALGDLLEISYVNAFKSDPLYYALYTFYDKSSDTEYSIHLKSDAIDMLEHKFTKISSTEIKDRFGNVYIKQ